MADPYWRTQSLVRPQPLTILPASALRFRAAWGKTGQALHAKEKVFKCIKNTAQENHWPVFITTAVLHLVEAGISFKNMPLVNMSYR